MRKYKTLKAWLRAFDKLASQLIDELKGTEKLSKSQYQEIGGLCADVFNDLGEINDFLHFRKVYKI